MTKKGFTLIELLVVVAIIGMLASIVITSMSEVRASARDAKRIQEIKELQKALELYALNHNGEYPPSTVPIAFGCFGEGSEFNASLQTLVDNNYISQIPMDPINTSYPKYSCFGYISPANYSCGGYNPPGGHKYILLFQTENLSQGFDIFQTSQFGYCLTNQ